MVKKSNTAWVGQLCKVDMSKISSIHQITNPKIVFIHIRYAKC